MTRSFVLTLVATFFALMAPVQAESLSSLPNAAEVPGLEQSVFIDSLSKGGYGDVMQRVNALHPPETEFDRIQIDVASYRLAYKDSLELSAKLARTAKNNDQRRMSIEEAQRASQAFDDMLAGMKKLTEDFSDQPLRPMWQTDYAETLLTIYLNQINRNAEDFCVYGVGSEDQEKAFGLAAGQAFVSLTDADSGFSDRQFRMPNEEGFVQKYRNTGLWDVMIRDYWQQLLPYYQAQAALYLALAPDSAPYYQRLKEGPDIRIPGQMKTIPEERKRLFQLVIDRGNAFLDQGGQSHEAARHMIEATQGMAYLNLGQYDKAVRMFDEVLSSRDEQIFTLRASLGRAYAMGKQGNYKAAQEQIQNLETSRLVKATPLYRLLLADAEHRILMEKADKLTGDAKTQAVSESYDPYMRLFADQSIAGNVLAFKMIVYDRWAEEAQGKDMATLPPAVRFGIGESAMMQASQQMADAAENRDDAEKAAQLKEQARAKFEKAIASYDTLLGDGVPDNVKAPAMYQDAMANYQIGQTGVDGAQQLIRTLKATDMWVRLAKELPQQPEALQGMFYASKLLQYMHSLERRPAEVVTAYPEMAALLIKNYPDSPTAADQRWYYGQVVLRPQGKLQEAINVFAGIPVNHQDYFSAQRERLFTEVDLLETFKDAEQLKKAAQTLLAEDGPIMQIRAQAQQAADAGGSDAAVQAAREAMMASYITEARVYTLTGEPKKAVAAVANFEKDFAGQDDFIPLAIQARIMALSAQGDVNAVTDEAVAMMKVYPDTGAGVVQTVLDKIEVQIDSLNEQARNEQVAFQKKELLDRVASISSAASQLADQLYQWASSSGLTGNDLIPYQLIQVKTRRMAGKPEQALGIIKNIYDQFPNDPQIMTSYGETLLAVGDPQSLTDAKKIFDNLVRAYQNERPLPPLYWNAWVRYFQIAEKQGQTKNMSNMIRQLQGFDPNLGGPPYRQALEELAQRNP